MKIVGYCALHYGLDFLPYAIKSVIDFIDEMFILYSPVGSHGSRTSAVCPDSRADLYAAARAAAGSKLRWIEGDWVSEGSQRETIHAVAPDADIVLVLDADEVWSDGLAKCVLSSVFDRSLVGHAYAYRLPMIHYWRSFHKAVVDDASYPARVILPKRARNVADGELRFFNAAGELSVVHHYGYAQRPEIVEYKQHTHGHRGEWRRDIDWYHSRFLTNAQRDCHPVNINYWNPVEVDPFARGLPSWMADHPYWGLDVIK